MSRFFFPILLGLLLIGPVRADWWDLEPMPTPRSEMSAAAVGDLIYVPGGLGGMRRLEAYDTRRNRWLELQSMPEGRHHIAIAAYQGKIYVFGGADSEWRASDSTFVFATSDGQWSRAAPMPAVRYAAAAVSVGPFIYVVGGDGPGGNTLRYDPARNQWRVMAKNLQRREHTTAVNHFGEIMIIGGRWSGVGELASTEIFDPQDNAWRPGPALNIARGGFTAVVHEKRIYAFGGEVMMNGNQTLASVEVLTDQGWQAAAPMPLALHGVPVVSHDGNIYVLGGSQRAGAIVNDGSAFSSADY